MLASKKQQGFNLIEMAIALIILSIGMTVAIPSFQGVIKNAQTKAVGEALLNGLQLARLEAVKRGQLVSFTINNADYSWVVGCVNVTASCPAVITEKAANKGDDGRDVNVTITGSTSAVFTSLGNLTATADQLSRLDVINDGLRVSEAKQLSIILGAGGNARLCDARITNVDDPRRC